MQLSKHNEVYLKLDVDSGLSQELSDYFTFEVPGARFMPAYKKRIWDGKLDYSHDKQVKYMSVCYHT